MRRLIVISIVALVVFGHLCAEASQPQNGQLHIFIDCSGSIPNDLFCQALETVADALEKQSVAVEVSCISISTFSDHVSLLMPVDSVFNLPAFQRDSIISAIRREYGIVGKPAKDAYDRAVGEHSKHLGSIVSEAAEYIRGIKNGRADMTDIAGLFEYLDELDSTAYVVVVSDFLDENNKGQLENLELHERYEARRLFLYVPSIGDLRNSRGVRVIFKKRKRIVEQVCCNCLVCPLGYADRDWLELLSEQNSTLARN